ncbi:unnamed protein product [Rotaria sp. Silwood1]|nr:unnamed protein product [Rotaria sp. Silwood1]CAF1680638.1 unnamed protein product [Rotaria sp. Silwood1]CAF3764954.1 unnamed protein product [Rotaria sp. Silwood1]CAF3961088.1 unnamed protein product [Rotaria sp. Silwood1]CAF4578230.1 unnamed protein product [Rotaria sp. Silwood1]
MATATTERNLCHTCQKAKGISKCEGCSQIFCFNHFVDHRQELNKQFDEVELTRDLFRQTLSDQTSEPGNHILIQQINDWEQNSVEKIRHTADEIRKELLKHTAKNITDIEIKLNELTDELRQCRQENDFIETDLHRWKNQLSDLTNELNKPSNITIRQGSNRLVKKIYLNISARQSCMSQIDANTRWVQNGITVAGGNKRGDGLNQLDRPWGICIDDDEQTIYIADTCNHRIIEWKYGATHGRIVAGGNGEENPTNLLNNPRDVVVDKEKDCLIICDRGNSRLVQWPRRNGTTGLTVISDIACIGLAKDHDEHFYVSDGAKHEVRRWRLGDTCGTVVAGGNGQGSRLDQLNGPRYIFIDQDYSVYISDENNHRVIKWTKGAAQGIVVAGGQGKGNGLAQLSGPRGVVVDSLGTVYVADSENNRVMRWLKEAKQGSVVIDGNDQQKQLTQLHYPQDLSFDRQGNLYVVDFGNDRIQRFNIDLSSS